MSEATRSAAVGKLDVLVGEWELEAEFSGMEPMRGARSTFEWVLDGRFLLQRTEVPVAEAPDSLALVGVDPDSGSYLQHYYDSRGVARVYMMTMDDGVWQLFRDRADFLRLSSVNASSVPSVTAATLSAAPGRSPKTARTGDTTSPSPIERSADESGAGCPDRPRDHRGQPRPRPGHRRCRRRSVEHPGVLRPHRLPRAVLGLLPDGRPFPHIAARATVSIAIFDSHSRIGTGQGVYMSAIAAQVKDTELAPGITVFSDRSLRHGGVQWTAADVTGDSELRLYRATADQHWILAKDGEPDHRIPVDATQ
jgi:hypothetical protein